MKSCKMNGLSIFVFLLILLNGCQSTPHSKEDYIQKFDAFVNLIEEDYQTYSEEVWEQKDRMYKDYAEKWFVRYKDEMDFKEQIRVKKNVIKYQLYRNNTNLKEGFKEGIEAIKELGGDLLEVIESSGDSILNNIDIDLDIE